MSDRPSRATFLLPSDGGDSDRDCEHDRDDSDDSDHTSFFSIDEFVVPRDAVTANETVVDAQAALRKNLHDDGAWRSLDPPPSAGDAKMDERDAEHGLRRWHALMEVVRTEAGYVQDLRVLIHVSYLAHPAALLDANTPPRSPRFTLRTSARYRSLPPRTKPSESWRVAPQSSCRCTRGSRGRWRMPAPRSLRARVRPGAWTMRSRRLRGCSSTGYAPLDSRCVISVLTGVLAGPGCGVRSVSALLRGTAGCAATPASDTGACRVGGV